MSIPVKTVEIVSLSSGIIGETFVRHELEIGVSRLEALGLNVKFGEHALRGLDFIREHPEARVADLLAAFRDPEVDMILCAIGGDDTLELAPYLFENDELKSVVCNKIFLGFSDTTRNHFMLHNLGLNTFYGQSFLADLCELDTEMLPYTLKYFKELITTGTIREITPSDVWYEERTDFGESQIGVPRISHPNSGFELLRGPAVFSGPILGGCVESMFDSFDNTRHANSVELSRKYGVFPPLDDWKGKILLLETSEEKHPPEEYRQMIRALSDYGLFNIVSGVIVGKPMDEAYYDEYKQVLFDEIKNPDLPIVFNVNVGHATPRCIIPLGVNATVNVNKQIIRFN